MAVTILVRKYTASPRFKSHYNTTMDRYYHTRDDYLGDLKSKGLQPYDPNAVKEPVRTPHKPSKWARNMYSTIQANRTKDGRTRVGSVFHRELEKHGVSLRSPQPHKHLPHNPNLKEGGFDASD